MQIKRTVALILAVLLASSTLACGSGDAKDSGKTTEKNSSPVNSDETETAKETTPYEALGENDFEGRKFTIVDANTSQGLQVNIPEDEMNGEVVNDALIVRDKAIEDKYNIKETLNK